MKIKKILKAVSAFALCAALIGAVSGCGSDTQSGTTGENTQDKVKVGIILQIENGAFTDMRDGFIEGLREAGYTEDKCEIDYKCAQGDMSNLNTIVQDMISSGKDLVATVATPASQAFVSAESGIPNIFISVSNPVGAGIISDMNKPDKNSTGTSNAVPVEDILGLAEKLTPDIQTYGLLYCTNEINSVTTCNNAKEYLDSKGIKYVEAVVTNSSEVQQAAQALAGSVDAIFVPNDSVIQNAMPQVAGIARDAKIPVYGSSATMVDSGAFATVAISDVEIGKISAQKAVEYLSGTPIEEIPAVVVPASDMVINQTTADALGIELSDEVKSSAKFVTDK